MAKYPEFIEWLKSIKLDDYYLPSEESLKNLYSQLEPYSFEELERNIIWMLDDENEYYGGKENLLIYAMKARDLQRTSRFFSQPAFWYKLKWSFLKLMAELRVPIEPSVLEKALKDLQEEKPESRFSRDCNLEKIGCVLCLMKIHGGTEVLARIQVAEESEDWPTVEVLLRDRLREKRIPEPGDPWKFLEHYGQDLDHPTSAPKEMTTIFAIFDFDEHICGDGLLVFNEHDWYDKNPFMPRDFAEYLRIIGDEEMADLMDRFDPVYVRYCDPDIEMTDEEWKNGKEPFEDEYFERNTKTHVLAYRYILNHPEIFERR